MSERHPDAAHAPDTATLVVGAAVSRVDALAVIALAVDGAVSGAQSADASVRLPDGSTARVEIPRFGDPPPFAIDVTSPDGVEAARTAALALRIALQNATGWEVRTAF